HTRGHDVLTNLEFETVRLSSAQEPIGERSRRPSIAGEVLSEGVDHPIDVQRPVDGEGSLPHGVPLQLNLQVDAKWHGHAGGRSSFIAVATLMSSAGVHDRETWRACVPAK